MPAPPKKRPEERIGQVIRGTYELVRLIGKGGMGEIYEAKHVSLPRKFAIKVLAPALCGDEEILSRFYQEASIAASLGSEHMVEVYDFNQDDDGTYFMAMELLQGESLNAHLGRVGALSAERWQAILGQVCEGLHAAHSVGIIHRDLKPDNLFLTKDRRGEELVKILDFGISKIRNPAAHHTQTGAVIGTVHYMSPEQAEGNTSTLDARSDIFSLGAVSYEALSGIRAFPGPSLTSVLIKICTHEPRPLRELVTGVPQGVADAVTKALAKDPAQRYESARAFLEAYRVGLGQSPADSDTPWKTSPEPPALSPIPSVDDSILALASMADSVVERKPLSVAVEPSPTTLSGSAAESSIVRARPTKHTTIVVAAATLLLAVVVLAIILIGGRGSKPPGSHAAKQGGESTSPGRTQRPDSSEDSGVIVPTPGLDASAPMSRQPRRTHGMAASNAPSSRPVAPPPRAMEPRDGPRPTYPLRPRLTPRSIETPKRPMRIMNLDLAE